MKKGKSDYGLHTLLDLHGLSMVVDDKGHFWVKFVVREVPVSPARPHGLDYSLTLHDASGQRVVGFDNAHPVKGGKGRRDHQHWLKMVKPYSYADATTLLADFWREVDKIIT